MSGAIVNLNGLSRHLGERRLAEAWAQVGARPERRARMPRPETEVF